MTSISIRWGKENINVPDVFVFKNGLELKKYLESVTGVPPDRQTITGIGKGILKDSDEINQSTPIKKMIRMMGSSEKIPEKPKEEIIFAEDIAANEEEEQLIAFPPGLSNLGNTCYMNSVVQVLRTIPEIKESVSNFKGPGNSHGKVVAALRDLYKSMDERKSAEITPGMFVAAVRQAFPLFNAAEDTPFGKMYSQQDAEEFLNTLRNAIASELLAENLPIGHLFVGRLKSTYTNQETDETPEVVSEEFHSLKCFINKETKHLLEGLTDGLKGTVERHSEKLNRNASYSKQSVITELPQYLMVNFVRFFWKQKEQIQNKIIKKVKFPTKLDIAPLCSEELSQAINETRKARIRAEQAEMDKKRLELTREARELKQKEEEERAKRQGKAIPERKTETVDEMKDVEVGDVNGPNGDYELIGIVTHKGRELTSGHYVAWVKEDGKWLKFDDDYVQEVPESEILELSGGGDRDIAYITLWKRMP